jgi:hypothetical protein
MGDSVVKSVDILMKENLIRIQKKKLHQNQTKNKRYSSIFSNGRHLLWRAGLTDIILKGNHLKKRLFHHSLGPFDPSSFRDHF